MYFPFFVIKSLHLDRLKSPSLRDALCQVWLKLVPCFWKRRWKCKKLADGQTDGQIDGQQLVIRKAHLSFLLRWAKKIPWTLDSNTPPLLIFLDLPLIDALCQGLVVLIIQTMSLNPQAFSPTHGSTMLHSLVYIKICMNHINQLNFILAKFTWENPKKWTI